MEEIKLTADVCEPVRADKYIVSELSELTRSHIQKLIEDGNILINGKPCSKKTLVKKDDEITVLIPTPVLLDAKPQDIPIDIVYEDDDVIIVNKPRNMVVHPAGGNPDGTLVNALMYRFSGSLSTINGVIRPGIVHRIDKDTTGILMVAKNDHSHLFLSEQIKDHSFVREYIALCDGNIKEDTKRIDKPIGRSEKDRKKMAVTMKNSKEAITDIEVIKRFGTHTLIKCKLYTGRTHQIRVHLSSIGHAITGDSVYGAKKQPLFDKGQLLHAYKLGFIHPKTNKYIEFTKDIPEEFEEVLKKLQGKENDLL